MPSFTGSDTSAGRLILLMGNKKFKSMQISEDLWFELQEDKINFKKKGYKVNSFEDVIRELKKQKKRSIWDMDVKELINSDL